MNYDVMKINKLCGHFHTCAVFSSRLWLHFYMLNQNLIYNNFLAPLKKK